MAGLESARLSMPINNELVIFYFYNIPLQPALCQLRSLKLFDKNDPRWPEVPNEPRLVGLFVSGAWGTSLGMLVKRCCRAGLSVQLEVFMNNNLLKLHFLLLRYL